MSTWVVQVIVVALFALTCGALAGAWLLGRLGIAAIALFSVALVAWVTAVAAIASEFRNADDFATCVESCTTVHYVAAVAFIAPPLLIALAGLAMIVARGSRWRLKRQSENQT